MVGATSGAAGGGLFVSGLELDPPAGTDIDSGAVGGGLVCPGPDAPEDVVPTASGVGL